MKKIITLFLCILSVSIYSQQVKNDSINYFLRACGGGYGAEKIEYEKVAIKNETLNKETVDFLINKMIKAHGGYSKWEKSKNFSFTHVLIFGQPLDSEFWISNEITEIKTERSYQNWPVFDGKLSYDGNKIWTENWELENPPGANVNNIYYALAMPWLTKNKNVKLEADLVSKLPGDSLEYFTIKMTFDENSKHSSEKYYKLFIDSKSFLLKGLEFNITYKPFLDLIQLPKEVKSLGPFTHVFYKHAEIDGMILPLKYDTFDGEGHNSGRHIVYDYSFSKPFDLKRMKLSSKSKIANEYSDR